VTAAGNDAQELSEARPAASGYTYYPAMFKDLPNMITVGAISQDDSLMRLSRSDGSVYGSNFGPGVVDIAAPGKGILTTQSPSNGQRECTPPASVRPIRLPTTVAAHSPQHTCRAVRQPVAGDCPHPPTAYRPVQ
jgi:hypothetical protein